MTVLYFFIILSLLIFLTIVSVNALAGPMLKKNIPVERTPKVSVLIPARNEERNILACLKGLLVQDYPDFEIIILDDNSEDLTSEIVRKKTERESKIRFFKGKPLPDGWTGKNWACHQLSEYARGEVIIFTDADNRHKPNAISNTLGWMQKYHLDMFSAFPRQVTGSWSEKLVVPVIDLFVYTGLVLWLTYFTRFVSLAAANGQWIAFRKKAYQKIGGHRSVSNQIVEDVQLSRLVKKSGLKMLAGAGTGIISGYMYHSFAEVWQGFSKNLFGLVSNRILPFFLIMGGLFIVYLTPFILVFFSDNFYLGSTAIALVLLLRLILAVRYKHPVTYSLFLHPIGMMLIIGIGLNSFFQNKWGSIHWKKRTISFPTAKRKSGTQ